MTRGTLARISKAHARAAIQPVASAAAVRQLSNARAGQLGADVAVGQPLVRRASRSGSRHTAGVCRSRANTASDGGRLSAQGAYGGALRRYR